MVGEHGGAVFTRVGAPERFGQVVPIEDVVAEHQRRRAALQELPPDQERLRQAFGPCLDRIPQVDSPLTAIAQQLGEARRVLRRRNQQDVANARQH